MSRSKGNKLRWVVGIHSVMEALSVNPGWVEEVYVQEDKSQQLSEVVQLAQKKSLKVKERKRPFFADLSEGHQGVAVSLNQRPRWDGTLKETSIVAFLDEITDPHNLGAILRTAWLMNVEVLFIPKNRAAGLTPTTCKVASGGAEHVPIEEVHFTSQAEELKKQGYWIFGLSEKGEQVLPQMDLPGKMALVLGAEGSGLRSSTQKMCDELVRVPQSSAKASYNASVAFSLATYEFFRKQF